MRLQGILAAETPVQLEIADLRRQPVQKWIEAVTCVMMHFCSQAVLCLAALSIREYARIVHHWLAEIGLGGAAYGTHSMRRTKASLIYRYTQSRRFAQLLPMHTN